MLRLRVGRVVLGDLGVNSSDYQQSDVQILRTATCETRLQPQAII